MLSPSRSIKLPFTLLAAPSKQACCDAHAYGLKLTNPTAGLNPANTPYNYEKVVSGHVIFVSAASEAHKVLSPTWSDRIGESFLAAIERYANPVLGKMRVDDVAAKDIVSLAPIWSAKPDLGRKQRQRISTVLSFAKAQGWRTSSVPTAAELSHGLGKQPVGRSYAAMPFGEVPAFFDHLLAMEQRWLGLSAQGSATAKWIAWRLFPRNADMGFM